MSAAPQLSATRGYIGGGNVAGILGVSPYKTPLDEFLTITGQVEPLGADREAFFRRRKALEPFAAEVFEGYTGMRIVARNAAYIDPEHVFLRAEIDFETDDGGNGETKTVHPLAAKDWGDSGSDEFPIYVAAQAMHGLMITGRPHTWIHAIVGLDDDRVYRIDRDEQTIAHIREREVSFWNTHVMTRVAPEPINAADVLRLFPRDSARLREADDAAVADIERIRYLQPLVKELDAVKDRVRLYMRDATALTDNGRTLCTWKAQTSRRFDQEAFASAHPELFEQFKKATDSRVLRIK